MRDGVRLATDVYLPDGWDRGPTVLVRLPYGKRDRYTFMPQCAPWFNDRGYAFVVQDVRGKGESEGSTDHIVHEVPDGYDTLEWIVRSGWSNGAVGMFGDSYYAYTQWAALASGHEALRAIVPRMSSLRIPTDEDQDAEAQQTGTGASGPNPARDDGIGRPPSAAWARYLAGYWLDNDEHMPPMELSDPPMAAFEEFFTRIGKRSSAFDSVFPRAVSRFPFPDGHPVQHRAVPTLHVLGWFDPVAKAGMETYLKLTAHPAWAPLQHLSADATDHENYQLSDAPARDGNDHGTDDEALARLLPRYLGPALDFFDVYLAGTASPDTLPRVRWTLGHVGDFDGDQWPPREAVQAELFLDGLEQSREDVGLLTPHPPTQASVGRWNHDPRKPVPDIGDSLAILETWPDESDTGRRQDVLAFDGPVAEHAVDIVGPVELELTVASSRPSMDVFVKLFDVEPDGTARRLLSDQITVSRVNESAVTTSMELGHIAYRLQPGHRLRMHVASSESPTFLHDPGVDGNRWLTQTSSVSRQQLLTSPDRPSRLVYMQLPHPTS
ncbi:CocE/NonD family hydrolase [Microbacterium sp. LWH3-1.2]|uniref:CocE/NonD family hydrolase n=1 Tax=Microbacterium sp. LWH3-1.2 TaxID=3135256 RepID=UPI003414AFE0